MNRSENNRDRARASRAGAVDADERAYGATLFEDRAHERKCPDVSASHRPQCRPPRSNRWNGATPPTLRGSRDSPQAPPARSADERQAGRTALSARTAAYPPPQAQEDPSVHRERN